MEERWRSDNKNYVKHDPWNKSGEDPEEDGEMPPEAVQEELPSGSADVPKVVVVNTRESAPRQV